MTKCKVAYNDCFRDTGKFAHAFGSDGYYPLYPLNPLYPLDLDCLTTRIWAAIKNKKILQVVLYCKMLKNH